MTKFTTKDRSDKPRASKKKAPAFPLTRHPRGYWCEKVRGKLAYFGKISEDPDGEKEITLWAAQKDELLADRTTRER